MKFGIGLVYKKKVSSKQCAHWQLFFIYIREFKNSYCTVYISWLMREVGCRSPHIAIEQFQIFLKISQLNRNLRVCMKFIPCVMHFCLMWIEFLCPFLYWLIDWVVEWVCVNGTRKVIVSWVSMLEFVCRFHICGSDLVEISDWHATSKYFGSLISFLSH
jgi:hypothetical protein